MAFYRSKIVGENSDLVEVYGDGVAWFVDQNILGEGTKKYGPFDTKKEAMAVYKRFGPGLKE